MRVARIAWRLTAMAVVSAAVMLAALTLALLGDRTLALRARLAQAWFGALAGLLGMRRLVVGAPPPPGALLVANHLGYVDVVALGSLRPTLFVAKAEVAGWPVLGALSRAGGTLFVDRGARRELPRTVARMGAILERGVGLVVFPEGTSSEGAEVLPFRPPLLDPAARGGYGVWHASLTYSTPPGGPPARQAVCWWGDMTFGRHFLDLLALPGFAVTITFGPAPVVDGDRHRLAARLHHEVAQRFTPVDTWTPGTTGNPEGTWTASAS